MEDVRKEDRELVEQIVAAVVAQRAKGMRINRFDFGICRVEEHSHFVWRAPYGRCCALSANLLENKPDMPAIYGMVEIDAVTKAADRSEAWAYGFVLAFDGHGCPEMANEDARAGHKAGEEVVRRITAAGITVEPPYA